MTKDSLEREVFGTTADGETVYRVKISGGGLTAYIMTWGASFRTCARGPWPGRCCSASTIFAELSRSFLLFRRDARPLRQPYRRWPFHAGRQGYQLELNEKGVTHLHGGNDNIAKRNWTIVEHAADRVVLKIVDPDGRAGYPGNCTIQATYWVHGNGELSIIYD